MAILKCCNTDKVGQKYFSLRIFLIDTNRSFSLSVRESVILLPRLTRECTGVMVVNFVRMSLSSLSFVLFQMTNRNLDESDRTLMFDEDITLHLQGQWTFLKHLLGAIRIDRQFQNSNWRNTAKDVVSKDFNREYWYGIANNFGRILFTYYQHLVTLLFVITCQYGCLRLMRIPYFMGENLAMNTTSTLQQ